MPTLFRRRLFLVVVLFVSLCFPLATIHAQTAVAAPFRNYYAQHAGMRVLGYPLSELVESAGYPAQYFEKGRIEDHRSVETQDAWRFMYGRLTAELIEYAPSGIVNNSGITYATLAETGRNRRDPPPGFSGGVQLIPHSLSVPGMSGDGVFIPYESQLRPAPGYLVPILFWQYINRSDYFPGGWLHDIGLPMGEPLTVDIVKQGELRRISMQAFERTVLTFDPLNPAEWQIERGNIGSDALRHSNPLPAARIDIPAANARVTLPVHLLAYSGRPGDEITARLRWQNGTEIVNTFTLLPSTDPNEPRGLLIGLLDWLSAADMPATQSAVIELWNQSGALLAQRQVQVLGPGDPDTRTINLFWVFGEEVRAHPQLIPATSQIGTAALEALLWGPPRTQIGFTTAIPTPLDVLRARNAPPFHLDWGPRVTLRSLRIVDGVATADFSRELWAYGGGSLRVKLIYEQISKTLLQFPSVQRVQVTIEGQSEGVLQP